MPRYWSRNNPPYEVDFLIQRENDIFPVEVKSEANITSKSMKKVNYPLSKANGLPASQTSFLRSTPVGAEQTSTGCFAPYYLHRR